MSINTTLIAGHRIVIAPESPAEMCRLLGTNHADVGWVCSRHNLINKWAKYKPVSVNGLIDTTGQLVGGTGSDKYQWKATADWWKRTDGSCGLEISFPNVAGGTSDATKSAATLANEVSAIESWYPNQWNYSFYPVGGSTSPYRLIDFNYYDHDAVCFIKSITYPSVHTCWAGENSDQSMTFSIVEPTGTEADYSIKATDISPVSGTTASNMRIGLLFVNKGSEYGTNILNRKYIAVNPYPISNSNGKSITLSGQLTKSLVDDSNIRSRQTYDIYPFLTSYSSGTLSVSIFGVYNIGLTAMPNGEAFRMELAPNELDGFIQGSLSYTIESGNRRFTGIYLSLLNTSATAIMSFNAGRDGNGGVKLYMDIYQERSDWAGHYTLLRTAQTGYTFSYYDVTMQPGGSAILNVDWAIQDDYFPSIGMALRVRGEITYSKSGASGTSISTLLALPPTEIPT